MKDQKDNDKKASKPDEVLVGSVAACLVIRDKNTKKEILKRRG